MNRLEIYDAKLLNYYEGLVIPGFDIAPQDI